MLQNSALTPQVQLVNCYSIFTKLAGCCFVTVADTIFQNDQQFAACSAYNICIASLKQSIEISHNQSIRDQDQQLQLAWTSWLKLLLLICLPRQD